jgi:hypothetical protein
VTPVARRAAADQATNLAAGLRDVEAVTATISARAVHTLCYGLAGTALLHACLGDTATATAHWDAAGRALGDAPPDGIHTGPGALAASLIVGTGYLPDSGPHHSMLPRATSWLSARAQALARVQQRTTADAGTPWAIYDAIKGLAGIGRILLAAQARGHGAQAAIGLQAALTTLTRMILTPNRSRPGWWLAATDHPPTVTVHPSGAANTGLAHGIAGPLAFLATAHLGGHTVVGQTTAIDTAAHWLLTWTRPGPTWPPYISGDDLDAGPAPARAITPGRTTAWCYGTPGIGRALSLAGQALADPDLRRAGRAAVAALADRTPAQWDTEGPGLCHGSAGVLQAATRTESRAVARQAAEYTTSFHDHGPPLGFPQAESGAAFNSPGFLTGAAGTALALADYAGLLPSAPSAPWDCLLLLV